MYSWKTFQGTTIGNISFFFFCYSFLKVRVKEELQGDQQRESRKRSYKKEIIVNAKNQWYS